jgi:hypothetical protein
VCIKKQQLKIDVMCVRTKCGLLHKCVHTQTARLGGDKVGCRRAHTCTQGVPSWSIQLHMPRSRSCAYQLSWNF